MLEINKKSWHYKVFDHFLLQYCKVETAADYIYNDKQISLCVYMTFVITGLFFLFFDKITRLILSIIWLGLWPFVASLALIHGFLPKAWNIDNWVAYKPFIKIKNNHYHLSHFIVPICGIIPILLLLKYSPPINNDPRAYVGLIMFMLILISLDVIFILLSFSIEKLSLIKFDLYRFPIAKKIIKTEETVKTPNIFFEYIKAKKQKVCPLIKFKD